MSFGKNQLSNISNNNLISNNNKIWRKNDGQRARSAARELELQQKLKLQAGLKDKENASEDINKLLTTTVHLSDTELSAKKKEFTQCVFYLDSLEPNATASIERAIVLLGAVSYFIFVAFSFFSLLKRKAFFFPRHKKSSFQRNALILLLQRIYQFKKICCDLIVIQSK